MGNAERNSNCRPPIADDNVSLHQTAILRSQLKELLLGMNIWQPLNDFDVDFKLHLKKVDDLTQRVAGLAIKLADLKQTSPETLSSSDKNNEQLANLPSQQLESLDLDQPQPLSQDCDNKSEQAAYPSSREAPAFEQKQYRAARLSDLAETAPDRLLSASLEMLSKQIELCDEIFFMHKYYEPWKLGTVRRLNSKNDNVIIRIRECNENKNGVKRIFDRLKYQVARCQYHDRYLKSAKRVIAGPDLDSLHSGIIGQEPAKHNKHRYLVFFDQGFARYIKPDNFIFPIVGQTLMPWKDCNKLSPSECDGDLSDLLGYYFKLYPRRNLVKTTVNDKITIVKNGNIDEALVIAEDCDVRILRYKNGSEESLYAGDPRLILDQDIKARLIGSRVKLNDIFKDLTVFSKHYHDAGKAAVNEFAFVIDRSCFKSKQKYVIRHPSREQVARKSTTSKYIYKTIKTDTRCGDEKMDDISHLPDSVIKASNHTCRSDVCLKIEGLTTELSVTNITEEFRDVSDLSVPLLLGWSRYLVKTRRKRNLKEEIVVCYESPCKKKITSPSSVVFYLKQVDSKLDIDYFTFERDVVINRFARNVQGFKALLYIENIAVDSENRPLERKPISLLNEYDEEALPLDFTYGAVTRPVQELARKGFTFNLDFKSCCDCKENCYHRSDCLCHDVTEEAYGPVVKGPFNHQCQYAKSKRLLNSIATGIFECNSLCSCNSQCPNRAVQNGIRFRLQIKKTPEKGWGVITLDDIPLGAFICTYAAELLDDADSYGQTDTYYADLDFITINESQKEKKFARNSSDEGVETEDDRDADSEEVDYVGKKVKTTDGHYKTTDALQDLNPYSDDEMKSADNERAQTRYPKRDLNKSKKKEPTQRRSKFKRIHDILESHDYTLDAKRYGNIGRFLNHSCDPNSMSQNVFIETHDLRFPTVAFFARRNIKALDEITWNYNYGSIPGRRIECHCGAAICEGRVL